MAKIYRLSDRIKLQVDDLVITVKPLSIHQKSQVEGVSASSGLLKASLEALKYSVDDIEGLEDTDGKPYVLKKNSDGSLSDETLEDIFNMEVSTKIITISLNLINGVPDRFIDLTNGTYLEGVDFVKGDNLPEKK